MSEALPQLEQIPFENYLLESTDFQDLGEKRAGKVRDIYENDDNVIFITTDRYSAFDRNAAVVPFKGALVNAISKYWFDATSHIIPHPLMDYPDPNVIVAEKCEVIPIEVIARGFITGTTDTSLWTLYARGQRDFGDFTLPDGLQKNQQLDEAVITPTTKLEKHDRPLTSEDIIDNGKVDPDTWEFMQQTAHELFRFGQQHALERGLILVDTKYEFGRSATGDIVLIDEVHTPDSSRYWQAESYNAQYENGLEPDNYDKEYIRLWVKSQCNPYAVEQLPEVPRVMTYELMRRYAQVLWQLTGQTFQPDTSQPIVQRIGFNLKQ